MSNLHWITATANRAKTNMTHEEFIEMCAFVSARFPVGVVARIDSAGLIAAEARVRRIQRKTRPKSQQTSLRFVGKTSLALVHSARATALSKSPILSRFKIVPQVPRTGSKDLDYSKVSGG